MSETAAGRRRDASDAQRRSLAGYSGHSVDVKNASPAVSARARSDSAIRAATFVSARSFWHVRLADGSPDPVRRIVRAPPSASLFVRRERPNRQCVNAARQFLRQQRIDHAMAIHPALSFERLRHNINPEMRSAARPMAGVTFVKM